MEIIGSRDYMDQKKMVKEIKYDCHTVKNKAILKL